jgi:hypothetical protein
MALVLTPEQQANQQQMVEANQSSAPGANSLAARQGAAPAPGATPADDDAAVGGPPNVAIPDAGQGALGGVMDSAQEPVNAANPRSYFAQKLGRALDKPENAIPLQANGKPQPGGWAKSLLGAAQGVLSGLGDAPQGKAPAGAGILSGVTGAISNHNDRMAAEKEQAQKAQEQAQKAQHENQQDQIEKQRADDLHQKAQLDNTEANMRMMHTENLNYQTGVVDPRIADGVKTVKMLEDPDSGHPTPIAARDVTWADVQKGIVSKKWNLEDYTAFPTGKKVVGTDEKGEPQYAVTYTLTNAHGKVSPNEDEIKYLNANKATDQPIKPGQEFDFSSWNSLHQKADDVKAQTDARNKTLIANKLSDADDAYKLEKVDFPPVWSKALADPRSRDKDGLPDPVKARNLILSDPASLKQFPDVAKLVPEAYPGFDKLESQAQEAKFKMQEEAAKKAADKAEDVRTLMTDDMKASIAQLSPDRQKFLGQYSPEEQGAIVSLGTSAGDVNFRDVFTRMAKGQKGLTPQDAENAIKQVYPHWSMAAYANTQKMYKDITGSGPLSKQIAQYNNVLQHAKVAQDAITGASGRINNPRFLNTALNQIEKQGWGAEAGKLKIALGTVKDEYSLLQSGGYKPSEQEQKTLDDAISANATAAQISGALKVLADVGAVRLNQINDQYKRSAGRNIPGILNQDSVDAANHLNVNPETRKVLGRLNVAGDLFGNDEGHLASEDLEPKTTPKPNPSIPQGNIPVQWKDANGVMQTGHVAPGKLADAQKKIPGLMPVQP